nr:leaf rust 10 disease-resistance locus receptor-like protein kinase-like 2.1 [Quercus suber]
MASVYLFVFFVLSHLLVHSAVEGKWNHRNCASFHCEKFGSISFPFASGTNSYCGLCPVDCDETTPSIQLGRDGRSYDLINISQSNTSYATIHVKDRVLQEHLNLRRCKLLSTLTFPNNSIISFEVTSPNQTLFKCKNTLNLTTPRNFKNTSCNDYNIYYSHSNHTSPSFPPECSIIQLPKNETSPADADLYALLTADFNLEAHVSRDCISCYNRGGQCQNSGGERFNCEIGTGFNKRAMVITLVTSLSGIGVLVVIICYFLGMLPSNKIWKKESPTYQNVKAFLRSHGPLEMVGVKNIDVSGDCTSEVYFPHWIYKRLELKEELELKGILNEADQDGAMKMIIVSLWCIQTSPTNRPPMSRVVDMLEGSLNSLQIPPNPFLSSPPRSSISSLQYDSVSSNTSLPSRQTLCLGGNEICEM